MLIHRKLWLKQEFSRILPGVQLLGGKQAEMFNQSQALIPIHCGWVNIRETSQEARRRLRLERKKKRLWLYGRGEKDTSLLLLIAVFSWGTCEFHSLAGSAAFPISILLLSGSSHGAWPLAGSGVAMPVLSWRPLFTLNKKKGSGS